jgi:hypothetical protein
VGRALCIFNGVLVFQSGGEARVSEIGEGLKIGVDDGRRSARENHRGAS